MNKNSKFAIVSAGFFLVATFVLCIAANSILTPALGQATSSNTAQVSIVAGSSSTPGPNSYNPSPLTVKVGTTVVWTNNDSTLHTVTSGLPSGGPVGKLFDSSYLSPGKTFNYTFSTAGTFDYHCTLHPTMVGKVIVS
ncbi:MAG TPA: cupredoxin family copper-binding protein [Nitrososphaeraceae archaeon]|jgi:plastocyanin|nr:cupredoxin family copper-binding protein [Nitrososphaeraceae archaeon]